MATFKNEAEFQTSMLDHIKRKGGFGFKIADSDCRLKPADCVVTFGRETFWLELKYRAEGRHPSILQHQENSCRRVWDAGGKYFFVEYDARVNKAHIITGFIPHGVELNGQTALELLGLSDFLV